MEKTDLILHYNQPAELWTEALPVGNGRLGAMVFGGTHTERIQLNEESLWTGAHVEQANPEALEYLDDVRNMLFEGKYVEAEKLAQEKIMAVEVFDKRPTYQTLGDLYLQFENHHEISEYQRDLNLRNAISTVTYNVDGVTYTREVFSSAPDQVITVMLTASKPGSVSFTAWMNRPGNEEEVIVDENKIKLHGFAHNNFMGTRYTSFSQFDIIGGTLIPGDTTVTIKSADAVLITISGRTSYGGADETFQAMADLRNIIGKNYIDIRKNHIQEYASLFDRVDFVIDDDKRTKIPTDRRLERVKEGYADSHLAELYFQYGRYLLISSSRPGCLPANLQGIWEPTLKPPWGADYHININLQMNYWPALVTNLAECQMPLFDFVEGMTENGSITAKETYGCRGIVAHHRTDLWQFTDPVGKTYWGLWPMGLAWCIDHFWEHYDYTGDVDFLGNRAYPIMREAALFYMDYLVENPETGYLVSGPSMSPENRFIAPSGERSSLCMGPSVDHQIIRELFHNCIRSAKILNKDAAFADSLQMVLEKLTPSQIGSDGRILEWSEELPEADSGHRHMSHLYALFPGEEFADPGEKWWEASGKVLETRLEHGGGHTGWSRAWIINFFARLHDSENAHNNLQALFAKSTLPNLFDSHPPFQIDGNFGGTAGIAEMLLQSHSGIVTILPALPEEWGSGHITGLRARGGFEVDIWWENHELTKLHLKSLLGNPAVIRYADQQLDINLEAGAEIVLNGKLNGL